MKVRFWHFLTNRHSSMTFWFFSFEYVDSRPKILLFRTHHLWNSTTELILNHTPKWWILYLSVAHSILKSLKKIFQKCSSLFCILEGIIFFFYPSKAELSWNVHFQQDTGTLGHRKVFALPYWFSFSIFSINSIFHRVWP